MNDNNTNSLKKSHTISAVIDRFEGDNAVLLTDGTDDTSEIKINFPCCLLPQDLKLKEGDYITLNIDYDDIATKKALQEAQELLNSLKSN